MGFLPPVFLEKIKPAYTPGDCTELCGVTDVGPGNEVKKGMVKRYRANLRSSKERLEEWKTGKVSASERRILATKWLGEAWEEYTSNHQDQITMAFKKCGMYNALDGSENHLIKVKGAKDYIPPKKDDPKQ